MSSDNGKRLNIKKVIKKPGVVRKPRGVKKGRKAPAGNSNTFHK